MENIEELKLANEKLNARLAKAVEVFKEQKTNLDNLTSQVESLQKELETYKSAPVADVSEYENKITLLEEDNIKLSEQNHLLEEKIQQNLEVSKSYNDQLLTIDELTKQNEDLQKQLNECELKLQNSENACEELQKEYELSEKQIAKLMDFQSFQSNQIQTLKTEKYNLEDNIDDLTKQNEDSQKQLNEYKLKLQDSETAYEQLNKKYEERKKQVAELMGSQADQSAQIEKLQIEKSDLEVNINDLTNRLSESVNGKTKYEEFTEMIIGLVESFTNNGNNIDTSKHSSITVNTYKNSTGSQFMSDAPGMNI